MGAAELFRPVDLEWEAKCLDMPYEREPLWLVCITCCAVDAFLVRLVFDEEPSAASLWKIFLEAMRNPETGEPSKPNRLKARRGEGWEAIRADLAKIGVKLVTVNKVVDYPD